MANFSQLNTKTKVDFRRYDYDKPNRCVPFKLPEERENKFWKLLSYLRRLLLFVLLSFTLIAPIFGQTEDKIIVDISNPKDGISYNRLAEFNGKINEIIINNSNEAVIGEEVGYIGGNKKLESPAKIILLEVVDDKPSQLVGEIKVVGKDKETDKIKLVIVNPNGIACDGCSFTNIDQVELRANRVVPHAGDVLFVRKPNSEIAIAGDGIRFEEGDLKLNSAKIKVRGEIYVRGELSLEAYLDGVNDNGIGEKSFAIDIDTSHKIYAYDIKLDAIGKKGGIKVITSDFLKDEMADDEERYVISGRSYVHINASGDLFIKGTVYAGNYLKIKGNNLLVYSPKEIGLKEEVGEISDEEFLYSDSCIRSRDRLELEVSKVYLDRGVKLKSSGFLKITGEVSGSGVLESGVRTSILSSGNISLSHIFSYYDTSLVAAGDVEIYGIATLGIGDVRLYGKKISVDSIKDAENLEVYGEELAGRFGIHNVERIEMMGKEDSDKPIDFIVKTPMKVEGDFKFTGRNFKCQSRFEAKNFRLYLSGDFINSEGGNIIVEKDWDSVSKGFISHQSISVGRSFKLKGDTLISDLSGAIRADSVSLYLTGQLLEEKYKNCGLYQGSDAVIESRKGKMEIIVPNGNVYFGYKKKFIGEGDNKDGYEFVGSQLVSQEGGIHIQAGGNVIFDGTQILGDIVVEAKGVVQENDPKNYKEVELECDVVSEEPQAAFCFLGNCAFPSTKTVVTKGKCTTKVPLEDSSTEETTAQKGDFKVVILETDFAGRKEILNKKSDLEFKVTKDKSKPENTEKEFSKKLEEMQRWHDDLGVKKVDGRKTEWFYG